jgi:hypothetical protein
VNTTDLKNGLKDDKVFTFPVKLIVYTPTSAALNPDQLTVRLLVVILARPLEVPPVI